MKLRNFIYLLLALPLLLAACDKDPNNKPSNVKYFMDDTLILGDCRVQQEIGNFIMDFYDEEGEYTLLVFFEANGTNNVLEAGTYTIPTDSPNIYPSILGFTDDRASIFFDGGDGTVVVEGDVNNYKIDIQLTDSNKRLYHFTYDGKLNGMSPNGDLPTEPINITAEQLEGYSLILSETTEYNLTLYDKPLQDNGLRQADSCSYSIYFWGNSGDVDAEGYMTIPAGTYSSDDNTLDNTTYSGYTKINEDGTEYYATARLDSGKLVVTADGLTLTVVIDGVEHTITYNGAPKLKVEQAM